jgi:hypothetical protein
MKHQHQHPPHPPQDPHSTSHALIQQPPLAIIPKGDGAGAGLPQQAPDAASREERIRQSAYALYEARGRVDGHDVDDWLIAQAQWIHAQPLAEPETAQPAQPSH